MKQLPAVLSYKKLQQLNGEGIDHPGVFRVLIVDDNIFDAELMLRELKRQSNVQFVSKAVSDKQSYEDALGSFTPDVVYCDFNIAPDFDALVAIRMLKTEHPEVSFVLVSGTLTEEAASLCLREGIDDYVLKSNMSRLPLSLINAVNKRKTELQKKEVFEKLVRSEMQIRNFARHLNKVIEEERSRLAREIHDESGQRLSGLKMGLVSLKNIFPEDNAAIEKINGMMEDVDVTMQSLRKISTELRPGILDSLGLVPSIGFLATEFEKKTGIKCRFEVTGIEQAFNKDISICYFRICQEALNNIIKHAEATRVVIGLSHHENVLTLKVTDNGKGIESEKLQNPFSMGLLGMQERASLVGGVLQISSKADEGTCIRLSTLINHTETNINH